jgi:hypothetical protein
MLQKLLGFPGLIVALCIREEWAKCVSVQRIFCFISLPVNVCCLEDRCRAWGLCGSVVHIIVSAAGLVVGNFGSDSIVVGSKKFIMVSQKNSAVHHYLGR